MSDHRSIDRRLARLESALTPAGRWLVGPHAIPDEKGLVHPMFLPAGAVEPHRIPTEDPRYVDAEGGETR